MDIWQTLCERAKEQYRPGELNPFLYVHHVVCAIETASGKIFTGFCVESCCGVLDLCAERVAALNMYVNSGETQIRRLVVFRDRPPFGGDSGMPCGACREFLMQLDVRNRDAEILTNFDTRETVRLGELIPVWWGDSRIAAQKR